MTATQRPAYPDTELASITQQLRDQQQFVAWRWEWRDGKDGRAGEWSKVLINPRTGRNARSNDPATWGSFDEAVNWATGHNLGIGYVFHESDPFTGIDFDDCLDPETGEVDPVALDRIRALDSYTEVSPSGHGVKVIVRATLPPGRRRIGKTEMYDDRRFFTLTGRRFPGSPAAIEDRQQAVDQLHHNLFGHLAIAAATRPAPASSLNLSDRDVIERASQSKQGAKFEQLMAGQWEGWFDSQSEADLSLANILRFWTGGDRAQVDRIFRTSGLYREKWERADYREARVLDRAFESGDVYQPAQHPTMPPSAPQTGSSAPQTAPSAAVAAPQPTNQVTPTDEFVTSTDEGQCAPQLARIAELEQQLASERERRVIAEQRNQTIMQTINNPTWTPAQAVATIRALCEYDSKVERDGTPYGAWQEINLTELSKGVPKVDPETGEPLFDKDGTPKLQTSMTKATISAALKTVAETAGVIELRERTDERGRSRLQMRALRPTPLETMRAHAEVFVQQDRARGRHKPKDPRLAAIEPCAECGPDADVIIKSDVYCGDCGQHLGPAPDEVIRVLFRNETVSSPPTVADNVPTGIKTKRSARGGGFWEARERHYAGGEPDDAPFRTETVDAELASDLCRSCGLRLFSPEERAFGRHAYDCRASTGATHPSAPAFVMTGDD